MLVCILSLMYNEIVEKVTLMLELKNIIKSYRSKDFVQNALNDVSVALQTLYSLPQECFKVIFSFFPL